MPHRHVISLTDYHNGMIMCSLVNYMLFWITGVWGLWYYCEDYDMAVLLPISMLSKEEQLSDVEPAAVRVSGELMCWFIIVSHFNYHRSWPLILYEGSLIMWLEDGHFCHIDCDCVLFNYVCSITSTLVFFVHGYSILLYVFGCQFQSMVTHK